MSDVTAVPLRPVGKSGIVALWAGVGLLLAVGVGAAYATTHRTAMSAIPAEKFLADNAKRHGVKTTASGVEYKVLTAGSGPTPTMNDVAQIEYRGTLIDGTEFDATKPGEPAVFPISQMVPGFSEALTMMPKGARYRVWLPPHLAYGERQAGPIPPHSVLVFDITMLDFEPLPPGGAAGM